MDSEVPQVLLKLQRARGTEDLHAVQPPPATHIALRYTDLVGNSVVQYHELALRFYSPDAESSKSELCVEMYDSNAVRKGILLHHYVEFVHELLDWRYGPLPSGLLARLEKFEAHFMAEAQAIGDESLIAEAGVFAKLREISEQMHGTRGKKVCCSIM